MATRDLAEPVAGPDEFLFLDFEDLEDAPGDSRSQGGDDDAPVRPE